LPAVAVAVAAVVLAREMSVVPVAVAKVKMAHRHTTVKPPIVAEVECKLGLVATPLLIRPE
jgi:hypothetical protein